MLITKLKNLIRKLRRPLKRRPEIITTSAYDAPPLEVVGNEFVVALDLTNTSGRPQRVELWRSKLSLLRGDRNEYLRPTRSEPRAYFDGDTLKPDCTLSAKVFFPYSPGVIVGAAWCLHVGDILFEFPLLPPAQESASGERSD